jgi:hypothetical protein
MAGLLVEDDGREVNHDGESAVKPPFALLRASTAAKIAVVGPTSSILGEDADFVAAVMGGTPEM